MTSGPLSARPPFVISTNPAELDLDAIYSFLSTCYWSPGIARVRVERAIANSLNFGVYDTATPRSPAVGHAGETKPHLPALAGFARIVTDRASYAYLCDVFILEQYRGQGLSKWLMEAILAHPDLQGLRRFCLMTRDAHSLYAKYGFTPMPDPSRYMERVDRESYRG